MLVLKMRFNNFRFHIVSHIIIHFWKCSILLMLLLPNIFIQTSRSQIQTHYFLIYALIMFAIFQISFMYSIFRIVNIVPTGILCEIIPNLHKRWNFSIQVLFTFLHTGLIFKTSIWRMILPSTLIMFRNHPTITLPSFLSARNFSCNSLPVTKLSK